MIEKRTGRCSNIWRNRDAVRFSRHYSRVAQASPEDMQGLDIDEAAIRMDQPTGGRFLPGVAAC